MKHTPPWLEWARAIQAIAQSGMFFNSNPHERERFVQLEALALEMYEHHTGEEPERIARWFKVQPGYATPKVDVRAACFREGELLLVREQSDRNWCLPGGWADVGDTPAEAALRELREESGFSATARKLIGVFDANRSPSGAHPAFHAYKLIFACEITGGEPRPEHDHEIEAVDFFARDRLPPLSIPRSTTEQLDECFAHLENPERVAYFDL